jgi:hypothetical protein
VPDRFGWLLPQPNNSDPLQDAHQPLQCLHIKPAPHFDAPPAVQHRRRRAACRTRSCPCAVRWLCGQQCVVASRRFPLPSSSVSAQRAQCQPPLPAELAPAQPTWRNRALPEAVAHRAR